jgi:hypothetical protein
MNIAVLVGNFFHQVQRPPLLTLSVLVCSQWHFFGVTAAFQPRSVVEAGPTSAHYLTQISYQWPQNVVLSPTFLD